MKRNEAVAEIKSRWRDLYQRDKAKGIICPLCGSGSGKNGSGISEDPKKRGHLKCWSCDFSGDVIDLKGKETGSDFNTALQILAGDLGISIENDATAANAFNHKPTTKAQAHPVSQERVIDSRAVDMPPADYTEYYDSCRQRLKDPDAISYLAGRGISFDTAYKFNLGYDPAWISPTAVKRAEAEGKDWRPPASPRIIMPVTKNHYVARDIRSNLSDYQKKFAKANETGGSSTGIFEFGRVYESVCFIVEGVIDALSIMEMGFYAVALNSTSNADLFLKQMAKSMKDIPDMKPGIMILALDNDDAGKKASDRLKKGLDNLNVSNIPADITTGCKDANEALVKDRSAFKEALDNAMMQAAVKPDNVSDYLNNFFLKDVDRFKSTEYMTGFRELDLLSGGIYPGFYVLAAISSLGKTTFAMNIADNLASSGNDVLFFSLEQSKLEMISKGIAKTLYSLKNKHIASSLAIRKGFMNDDVKEAIRTYSNSVQDRLNYIEGNFNCNIDYIRDYTKRYMERNNCKPVVFVDYLQILQPGEDVKRATTKEIMDMNVVELKRLSRELDIPVIAICSVNRSNYLTPIDFESLKESGGIEYTADVVWGLQLQCIGEDLFSQANNIKEKRERVIRAKSESPRKIELVCLKNRFGSPVYSCGFDYYSANDLYLEDEGWKEHKGATPFTPVKKAGKVRGKA